MSSRLFMNWQTHYTVPVVKNSRWIGGEGHAPVPTPRFGGAAIGPRNTNRPPNSKISNR